MAVEATHPNLFPQQFVQHRESFMNPPHEGHAYSHKFQATPFPVNQQFVCESTHPKTSINTTNRDTAAHNSNNASQLFGEFYTGDIDSLIYQHTMKIRLELQERQKLVVARMGESMAKTLREKDDQIQKMARLNLMLEEKAKGLYVENQLWQETARANEAAANSLRHALAQFGEGGAVEEAELESCGSCDETTESERRMCPMCGERQCCVLLLPCRHLCLCSGCGSGLHACPVCNASMTATLHVNMF
ncbi:RING-type E3 ubiquitin transferase [Salvia divinorum]|uniref:RING-type E3 ubiquitin transferase n=1 Tax=Salvia divinorum TaxID=28513 RepID=A0ABD1II72_SALDI